MSKLSVSVSVLLAAFGGFACTSDDPAAEEVVAAEGAAPAEGQAAEPTAEAAPAAEQPAEAAAEAAPAEAPVAAESAPAPAIAEGTLYVTTSGLNVRSGAGMSNGVVRVLGFRAKVSDLGRTRIWVKIGEGEYVSSHFLSTSLPDAPNDPVAKAAE